MSTLLLVTIVLLVAATMAGVFTLNMNITQRVSNGTVALNEAEAGIAEVLYQISRDENVSKTENAQQQPIIDWGKNNETLRSTITPGYSDEEAFHIVTFDPSSEFPHSTNNTSLDRNSGSLGRTVPDGRLHLVSTGYCKGQYRTVECVVERPPFPFGLATSGPINSEDPIVVKGVSSIAELQSANEDRPGHLVCNSPQGITIKAAPHGSVTTEISGFVKSTGPVNIEQPAVVRGGIRSFSDDSTLANLDVTKFKNQGEPGVITLMDSSYDKEQELDVMYYRSGDLRYQRSVQLKNAMIYVDGNLTVDGPLSGEGLIVVNGNATFNSGTALSGSNRMAVLASGDIKIVGNNNYFTGLVYAEGNFSAKDITIVGNTIVNSENPAKGRAELSNVTIVSNEETGDMTVTITSSTKADEGYSGGELENFPPSGTMNFDTGATTVGDFGANDRGYVGPEDVGKKDSLKGNMKTAVWDRAAAGGGFPQLVRPMGLDPRVAGLWDKLADILSIAENYHDAVKAVADQQAKVDGMDSQDPDYQAEKDKLETLKTALNAAEAKQGEMNGKIDDYVESIFDVMGSRTNKNGTFEDGIHPMDISKDIRFNLNEYLPESEKLKVSFYRVYNRRMK